MFNRVRGIYPNTIHLDVEEDEEKSKEIINSKDWPPTVPQTHILFYKDKKWFRYKLIGLKTEEEIKRYLELAK
jgi:hypothetical protein